MSVCVVVRRAGGVEYGSCNCCDQVNVDGVTYSPRASAKIVKSFVTTV